MSNSKSSVVTRKESAMNRLINAWTAEGPTYAPFVNFYEKDGVVTITLRANPTEQHGCYVCGYSSDRGEPRRCTPGDDRCNNYCNRAPEKGPMAPAPKKDVFAVCGDTVEMTMPLADFSALIAGASQWLRSPDEQRPEKSDV